MKIFGWMFPVLISACLNAQQAADTTFVPKNRTRMFSGNNRPVVLIDEAHHNFHTMDGRYGAFTKVLKSDGYIVKANREPFHADALQNADILVIANALHEANAENWDLPNFSAFTRDEIESVYRWVSDGGCLFLIADHMPFPAAAGDLAALFGFGFNNGYAFDPSRGQKTMFYRTRRSLCEHAITQGRHRAETIDSVRTFTGQAFLIPFQAKPVLRFMTETNVYMPAKSWDLDRTTPHFSADLWYQGATLEFGEGRIAVFGEAAMFTAQYVEQNEMWFGLRSEGAEQNEQFLLNIMHWLSKII